MTALLASRLDRIIFAVECCTEGLKLIESLNDDRVTVFYSSRRLGKAEAFNRCIRSVTEELVYLISCDVIFDPSVIDAVDENIDKHHSGAITNVESLNHSGIVGEASRILWDIRDTELDHFERTAQPIHGGEFIAIRREFLGEIPGVVNEDEYTCLQAQAGGVPLHYIRSLRVFNSVPATFRDYIIQRRRVIFGHMEIREHGLKPSAMNFRMRENFIEFALVLFRLIRRRPGDFFALHVTVILELISHLLARHDRKTRKNHVMWKVAESAKL